LESFGLIKTLEAVSKTMNAGQDVEVNISFSTQWPSALAWPVSLGFYRIIMELLQNSLKHADATAIGVTFECEPGELICRFRDNGHGLPAGGTQEPGAGLKNIEARVSAMDGSFTYGNADTGGFTAFIKVPNA